MKYDLCIIGGAGHVGLPLGVAFANKRVKTVLFDKNEAALEKIKAGFFPFKERNGDKELRKALQGKNLAVSVLPEVIQKSDFVLLVLGTPIDEYLNPDLKDFNSAIEAYFPYFKNGQILILRSTVYPGTSERIQRYFQEKGKRVAVAFCPERIAEGHAFEEFIKYPQIVSAFEETALDRVEKLFRKITSKKIVLAKPIEAELAKLYSNAWRYIQFAVANQFFMLAEDHGLDYQKIYTAMCDDYPRMQDLPRPGFAAGPCLFKDTMQLAAFSNNNFFLGHSAMLVNEGLPNYLIQKLKHKAADRILDFGLTKKPRAVLASSSNLFDMMQKMRFSQNLKEKTLGILGMAFKAESDDARDSLSYKLRKIAQAECKKVLCHDVYIQDSSFVPLADLLQESDIIVLAAPHKAYRKIDPRKYPEKQFIDIWGAWS